MWQPFQWGTLYCLFSLVSNGISRKRSKKAGVTYANAEACNQHPKAFWPREPQQVEVRPQWLPRRKLWSEAMQPEIRCTSKEGGTAKTFISELYNTEVTRHLNIVTPQLLVAVLGEEQLRHMWARLGPRDTDCNGNGCHGDDEERPTKGITNMYVSRPAWRWIMQGNAAAVPEPSLSLERAGTQHVRFGLLCWNWWATTLLQALTFQRKREQKRQSNEWFPKWFPSSVQKKHFCWYYGLAFSLPWLTNNCRMREGEKENQ